MAIKQLSVFVENKGGTLIRVLDTLSRAGIQIIASTIADTTEYGIYRILCDDAPKAYITLKDNGINVQLTEVFAVYVDNKVGEAARMIRILSGANVSIAYMYTFLFKGKGILIFKAFPDKDIKSLIEGNNFSFVKEEDLK